MTGNPKGATKKPEESLLDAYTPQLYFRTTNVTGEERK